MSVVVLIALLLVAWPAHAERILVFSDSRSTTPTPTETWPAQLQALRPADTVVNAGWPGERTEQGLWRLSDHLAGTAPYGWVFLMEGTNDAVDGPLTVPPNLPPLTPKETFQNLRTMAQDAKNFDAGTTVVLMTGYPCSGPFCGTRHVHERDVAHELIAWVGKSTPNRIVLLDHRDDWSRFDWASMSDIWGLHPDQDGAALTATVVDLFLTETGQ